MKKIVLLFCALACLIACHDDDNEEKDWTVPSKASRTVMIYMSGENNLTYYNGFRYLSADLNEIIEGSKKLADNETFDVNFIVRVYFTKAASRDLTSADGKYYFVESKKKVTIDNKIITGVTNVNSDKQVAGVKYYNLMGVESNEPFNGVNIVVTRYTDGSISTSKVLK